MVRFYTKENFRLRLFGTVAVLFALALVAYADLPCLVKTIFGIPCPACGMGRAWRSALILDFSAAFFYHPLFWLVAVLCILYVLFGLNKRWVLRVFLGTIVLFLAVYLVRIVVFFPETAPMDQDRNAVLFRLFEKR